MGYKMMRDVIESKKNIVDISFYPEDPFGLDELAKKNNISRVHDGLGMLFRQAALSFKIWTGLEPNAEEAMKIFRI